MCILFRFVSTLDLCFICQHRKLPYCLDNYHLAFPKDPLSRKILVYAVYTAGLTQTILYTQMAFKVFAAGFGGPTSLSEVGNFWFSGPIMCSTSMFSWLPPSFGVRLLTSKLVGFTVQLFYAYRIKTLAKSFFIPTVVFLVSLSFLIFQL